MPVSSKPLLIQIALLWPGWLAATTVLVDFGEGRPSAGNWNNVTAEGAAGLTDWDTGAATAIGMDFAGAVNDSTSTGQWGTRTVAPDWTTGVNDSALTDRLYILEGNEGRLTLSGLQPGQAYDIELAASYGGPGSSGDDAGVYELTDATGLVPGKNGYTGTSLGTSVSWTARGPGEGGVEGWLVWEGAVADGAGELVFDLFAPSGAHPRIALNAMILKEEGAMVDLPLALEMTGTGRFCPEDGAQVFGVSAPTEPDVTYTLFRDGAAVDSRAGNGTTLSFAAQTAPGDYTVEGTLGGYTTVMTGQAVLYADCEDRFFWPEWEALPAIEAVTDVDAPEYPGLPEVLRWFDFEEASVEGPAVTDAVEWYFGRRPEVIEMLEHYLYGRAPASRDSPVFTVTETIPDAVGGLARRLTVSMNLNVPGIVPNRLYLYLPKNDATPHPVIVALAKTTDPADWEPGGSRAHRWHMEQTLGNGYALAVAPADGFAPDKHGNTTWRAPLADPFAASGFAGDWQIIAVWAWGLSWMVDFLDTRPEIDPGRTIMTGFSRRGKACLWAAALDERVEMVAPHQTGSGGAHPSRPGWGTALTFRTQFRNWFLDSFNDLPTDSTNNGYEHLPFDQHFPVALVAPRWAFLSENATYGSNRAGLQAVTFAAAPAFDLLDPGNPENLRLNWDFLNPTSHLFEDYHWADIMEQADKLPLAMGGIRSFLQWRWTSGHFSEGEATDTSVSGRSADPDHDGLPNVLEFATGSHPRQGSSAPLRAGTAGDGTFLLTFPVYAGGKGHPATGFNAGGIEYTLQTAPAPDGPWTEAGPENLSFSLTDVADDPYRQWMHCRPSGGQIRAFYRLRVRLH